MAATPEGTRLTEAHRQTQVRLGTRIVGQMTDIAALLDLADLDASFQMWLRTAEQIIVRGKADSAAASANYFELFREFELGDVERFVPELLGGAPKAQVETVMRAEILSRLRKRTTTELGLQKALTTGLTEASRSAQRLSLDGGRNTLRNAIRQDSAALGHARVTSGSPCHFCAMLASRGPVYGEDSFARSNARFSGSGRMKVHNGCHCSSEPVFHRDAAWPPGTKRFADKWQDISSQAADPEEARLLFRQSMENR